MCFYLKEIKLNSNHFRYYKVVYNLFIHAMIGVFKIIVNRFFKKNFKKLTKNKVPTRGLFNIIGM